MLQGQLRRRSRRSRLRLLLLFMTFMTICWVTGLLMYVRLTAAPVGINANITLKLLKRYPLKNKFTFCSGGKHDASALECRYAPNGRYFCLAKNALIDASKLATGALGGLYMQCRGRIPQRDLPADLESIVASAKFEPDATPCRNFDDAAGEVVVIMPRLESSLLEHHLGGIEQVAAIGSDLGGDPARIRLVLYGGDHDFDDVWARAFPAYDMSVRSFCVRQALFISVPAKTRIEQKRVVRDILFPRSEQLAPTAVGILLPEDCSATSISCELFGDIPKMVTLFRDANVALVPLFGASRGDLEQLPRLSAFLITRGRYDALTLLLPETAFVVELKVDQRAVTPLRHLTGDRDVHIIAVHAPDQQLYSRNNPIFAQIMALISERRLALGDGFPDPKLPPSVVQLRARSVDPANPRLAIVIPFRDSPDNSSQGFDRTKNLVDFATYMTKWLTDAGRDFEIIVIEQEPGVLFNKAALFNIGYHLIHKDFTYMALHDVDQIPVGVGNDYAMPDKPLHLCSASSQYDWKPAYVEMVGGALLLKVEHFRRINGMSNRYWGWGMEDDDLYIRLLKKFNDVPKLPVDQGRYQALSHRRVIDLDTTPLFNYNRHYLGAVQAGEAVFEHDGISTIRYGIVGDVERSPIGFTKYTVSLNLQWMPKTLKDVAT